MKKITYLLLILFIGFNSYSQCKVKGVVSYFFNKYQGDKPDLGAVVYVVDSALVKNYDENLNHNFSQAKTYKTIYENYTKLSADLEKNAKVYEKRKRLKTYYDQMLDKVKEYKKESDDAYEKLKSFNAETDEKFKQLDDSNFSNLIKVTMSNKAKETVVDGSGNYEIDLNTGTYYVVIKSKNRNSISTSEALGKTFSGKAILKTGDVKNISTNFDQY